MMAATNRYPYAPTCLAIYRRRARWQRRLALVRRVGRWVLRQTVLLFWLGVVVVVICVAVSWGM